MLPALSPCRSLKDKGAITRIFIRGLWRYIMGG